VSESVNGKKKRVEKKSKKKPLISSGKLAVVTGNIRKGTAAVVSALNNIAVAAIAGVCECVCVCAC
jgi:hypothetical protein